MGQATVTAKIDANLSAQEGKVVLSGDPPLTNPVPGDVFFVKTGDKLKWVFRDKTGTSAPAIGTFTPRIRLATLVKAEDETRTEQAALISANTPDQGKTFAAQDNVIEGLVLEGALHGRYRYAVELVKAGQAPIVLQCLWEVGGGEFVPVDMGGGEKGGAPR